METKIIAGKIVENPYGNWSDVDTGWYIGFDRIDSFLNSYEGKNVKITIEIIPEVETDDSELIDFRLGYIIKNDAIKYFGLNPWCVNEGADPVEKYSCTMNKARELGLI